MKREIWRRINEDYQVSDLGNIKSLKTNKVLKLWLKNEYLRVCLMIDKKKRYYLVHTLVSKAFPEICGEWFEGAVTDHINGNTTDNRASNLRFLTASQSMHHIFNKTSKNYKLIQYTPEGKVVKEWKNIQEVENVLGWEHQKISACACGKIPSAFGYLWVRKTIQ